MSIHITYDYATIHTKAIFNSINIAKNHGAHGIDRFIVIDNEEWGKFTEYPEDKISFTNSIGEKFLCRSKELKHYEDINDFIFMLKHLNISYSTYMLDTNNTYIDSKHYHLSLDKVHENGGNSPIKFVKAFSDTTSIISENKRLFYMHSYDEHQFIEYTSWETDRRYFKNGVLMNHLHIMQDISAPISCNYEIIDEHLYLNIFFSYEKDDYKIVNRLNDIRYKNTVWEDIQSFSEVSSTLINKLIFNILDILKMDAE